MSPMYRAAQSLADAFAYDYVQAQDDKAASPRIESFTEQRGGRADRRVWEGEVKSGLDQATRVRIIVEIITE